MSFIVNRLGPADVEVMRSMLRCFAQVFEDTETYCKKQPEAAYLHRLMAAETFIALAATLDGELAGALVAYELPKFEQERSEIYIYDLAVYAPHRRKGVATLLIRQVQEIARRCGAWVVFVQADCVDKPAVQLYSKLGVKEKVLHFDLPL